MNISIINKFIQGEYIISDFLKMGFTGEDIVFVFVKGYIGRCKNKRTIGIEIINNNHIVITDVKTCTSVPSSNFNLFLLDEELFFGEMEEFKNKYFCKLTEEGYFKKLLRGKINETN